MGGFDAFECGALHEYVCMDFGAPVSCPPPPNNSVGSTIHCHPATLTVLLCVTSPAETATDALIGRVFEANLADLNKDESVSFRKMKFICEEVQGLTLLTNFHGMDLTRDKLCSLVKKWHTLVEAWCDVKTTDGYVLRMFCIGFTKRRHKQVAKTSYAQGGHVRAIRKKMIDIMTNKASKCDLNKLVSEFIPESIGHDIMVACNSIYPLNNVFIRKCKVCFVLSPRRSRRRSMYCLFRATLEDCVDISHTLC